MPNWCSNTLVISGNKKDVIELFEKVGFNQNEKSLHDFLETTKVTLRSWMPMPQTFKDVDTVNDKRKRDAQNYDVEPIKVTRNDKGDVISCQYPPLFNSDEEYEKYSKEYDDAVNYQQEHYGCVGWFDYNCMTLGCKWDATINEYGCDVIESDDKFIVTFNFDTAWCPPENWLRTLISDFHNLEFTLDGYEPGMCFHSHLSGALGEVVEDYEEDYFEDYGDDEEEEETEC